MPRDYVAADEFSLAGHHDLTDFPAFYAALCVDRPFVSDDVARAPMFSAEEHESLAALAIAAIVCVPLIKSKRLVAVFAVSQSTRRAWSALDVSLVQETAQRTWAAVERARAESALRRAHDELERRVAERTAELSRAVQHLWTEAREREAVERTRTELRRRLVTAQEDERRRVARDLHDQTGQLLTELALAVVAVGSAGPLSPVAEERMSELRRVADDLGRQVHGMALRLRPTALDDIGLAAALRQLAADWSQRTRVIVDLEMVGLQRERLLPEAETILYRVVQEALTNVAKHAGATRVSVVVTRQHDLATVAVEDDGCGFDLERAGPGRLGIVGMRERVALAGGEFDVESTPGQGTAVFAHLPLRRNLGGPDV